MFSVTRVVFGFVAIAASLVYGQASFTVEGGGNNATFGGFSRIADSDSDPVAIGNVPELDGAAVFDLTNTTTSDILLVDAQLDMTPGMNVPGGWYNETEVGTDTNPPNPVIDTFGSFQQIRFDTWVTTPSLGTAAAGANMLNGPAGSNVVTHSDSVDDGPQTDFTFARITLIPDEDGNASAVFRGTLQTRNDPTPVLDSFEYNLTLAVPEPGSQGFVLVALFGGLLFLRRRLSR